MRAIEIRQKASNMRQELGHKKREAFLLLGIPENLERPIDILLGMAERVGQMEGLADGKEIVEKGLQNG